jgi:poly(hydroxyalkanoate) depolymerase family esterase
VPTPNDLRVRRALTGLLLLLLVGAFVAPAGAGAGPRGRLTHGSYTQPGGLSRGYLLYVPASLRPGAPLVVYLHGCNETAAQALAATRFDRLADRRGFAVVYPEQVRPESGSAPATDGNGLGCWNWFLPEDQVRGGPEPAVLVGLTQHVARQLRSDRHRVYLEGISAGAAMTVNLAAAYPDVFAAVAALAGCSYSSCGDLSGALAYRQMGPRARLVPLLVENGTADLPNPASQSVGLAHSWTGLGDLVDDGLQNGSFSRTPATVDNHRDVGVPVPGTGDACVHDSSFLCLGGLLGLEDYPVTVSKWHDGRARDVVELWLVHGLAHAHPHATNGGPYTDPLGPDMTQETYRFFMQHRLG